MASIFVWIVLISAFCFAGVLPISCTFDYNYADIPDDLVGFRLYASQTQGTYDYGADSTQLIATIDYVDGVTSYQTEQSLTAPEGQEITYFLVATAYDARGNESGPSNEESIVVDFKAPPVILNLEILYSDDMDKQNSDDMDKQIVE